MDIINRCLLIPYIPEYNAKCLFLPHTHPSTELTPSRVLVPTGLHTLPTPLNIYSSAVAILVLTQL
jgi:hypothetical protein